MKKKWWIVLILVVILLIIILFPKKCGYSQGGYVLPNPFYKKECTCLGLKYETCGGRFESANCADMGMKSYCVGFPIKKRCFEVSVGENSTAPFIYKNIECKE